MNEALLHFQKKTVYLDKILKDNLDLNWNLDENINFNKNLAKFVKDQNFQNSNYFCIRVKMANLHFYLSIRQVQAYLYL